MATHVPRVRCDISANAIFTPREFKQFRRWQNLHTTLRPDEQGFLPTADEHDDFQQWLRKQDSGYFSDVFEDVAEHVRPSTADEPPTAISCRHMMHPIAAGHLVKRCPVCTVDMYISYVQALEKALKGAGGRAPRAANQASTEKQEALYAAFIKSKLEVLHYLEELELQAAEEDQWQAQRKDWNNDEVRTASQALDLYWSEAFAVTEAQSPNSKKKKKSVKFTPGTEFCVSRPEEYFKRRSPRYSPGKYTVQAQDDEEEDEEEQGQDIVSEDSEDYARAPILLEQGPLIVGQSIAVYDFATTIGVFTDTIRSYEAGIRKAEATPIGSFEIPRLEMLDDDEDDDEEDDESEWDMQDDETDGSDYIYFEAEEDCSFVVFGDD